jgi:transcriptional regulator with XRE-family HTH domain
MYSSFNNKIKEEIKMIGIEQYRKIQEYKALGLAQTKTAKALGVTYSSVSKYWNMSEEDYVREAEKKGTTWITTVSTYWNI